MRKDEIEHIFKVGFFIGLNRGWKNCENQDTIPDIKINQFNYEGEQLIYLMDNHFDEICLHNEIYIDENKIWKYKRKV